MTVRFQNLAVNVGGNPMVTSFTDTFQRADTAFGLGTNYVSMPRTTLQSSVLNVPTLRVLSFQLVALANGVGIGSVVPGTVWFPVQLLNTAVFGKNQFAELVFQASGGGGDVDVCPSVMMTGDFASNNQNGYLFDWDSPAGNLRLLRFDVANNILATTPYVAAPGDVWRIEVVCGAASNLLTLKVNGVTMITFTDAAGPIRTGYPVIWCLANVPANTRTFSRFSAGIL